MSQTEPLPPVKYRVWPAASLVGGLLGLFGTPLLVLIRGTDEPYWRGGLLLMGIVMAVFGGILTQGGLTWFNTAAYTTKGERQLTAVICAGLMYLLLNWIGWFINPVQGADSFGLVMCSSVGLSFGYSLMSVVTAQIRRKFR